jgi:hypothetical protein
MRLLLLFALAFSTSCTTITYRGDDNVRFSGPAEDEKVVRRVDKQISHHFFLGGIAGTANVDLAQEAELTQGETLTNMRVKTEQSGFDVIVPGLCGVLTSGICSPLIWVKRTTFLTGDVVTKEVKERKKKKKKEEAEPEEEKEKEQEQPQEATPTPTPTPESAVEKSPETVD